MIDQVPGYRILERAGEGGFSVVYRAHQERLDRVVALKVLSVDAVDGDTMRRFERECQITGRLTGHPNVVTVLDTGMTGGGKPFIAMDYFERGSLRDRLSREGPLPLQDVLRAGVKIAGALEATHEAGVLHRDVKPQNILVSKYGEPALADFGVARLVGSSEATHTNAFTPHHAAPEVVNGEAPGVPSDVYSLASTMYQLLAGEPAFRSGSAAGIAALMMRILNDPPPPIQRADVPRQVYDVIATAMAKTPGRRHPTAAAFAARLQRLQAELGLPVTEPAGSDSTTAPPTPYVPDHSGFTSPAMDRFLRPDLPPHLPAAHPDAPTPPPAPSPATRRPGPPSLTPRPAPPSAPVLRPREATPGTRPPTAEYDGPPEGDRKGRQGALVAGTLAAVVLGTGIGIGGFLVLNGGAGDGAKDPTPAPTSTPTARRRTAPVTPAMVPRSVMRAARPRLLRTVDKGSIVVLRWRLGRDEDYPIWVQQSDGTVPPPAPQALPARTETATLSGLDPAKGYCFKVGALVALGQGDGDSATIAWSGPACVRGARAQ